MIVMEVAAAYPERVRSMALLEPLPPFSWVAASDFADILGTIGPLMEAMAGRYQAGDVIGAYDALFTPQGLDWRSAAGAAGPGCSRPGDRGRDYLVRARGASPDRVELPTRTGSRHRLPRAVVVRATRGTDAPCDSSVPPRAVPAVRGRRPRGWRPLLGRHGPRGRGRADRRLRLAALGRGCAHLSHSRGQGGQSDDRERQTRVRREMRLWRQPRTWNTTR
jgi:hypothetical protein